MKSRTKEYLGILAMFASLSAIAVTVGATVGFLCHKPYTAKMAFGESLSIFLIGLWWGHIMLYHPRTVKQRVISWIFLFVIALADHAVMDATHRHTHSLDDQGKIFYNVIASAIETLIAVAILRRLQR